MKDNYLLVTNRHDSAWSARLRDILAPLGQFQVNSEENVKDTLLQTHYDLIIIDAITIKSPEELVAQLHSQEPDIHIVVVTVSPTWQEARAVLSAGAMDYLRWPLIEEDIVSIINSSKDLPHAKSDYPVRR